MEGERAVCLVLIAVFGGFLVIGDWYRMFGVLDFWICSIAGVGVVKELGSTFDVGIFWVEMKGLS